MSRFDIEFVKPFNREIKVKVKDVSAAVVADTAEAVFGKILDLWPIDTAWSAANHRLNVGRTPARDFPLEPPKRPKEKGALIGEANSNEQDQIDKLAGVKFGDSVIIGNAVPYAADVGRKGGQGTRIYIEAGAIGTSLVTSRIKQ